jgi:hypothetical protein
MRGLIGQPIIIENVIRADRSIGVGRAALARPDGYTIVLGALEPTPSNSSVVVTSGIRTRSLRV